MKRGVWCLGLVRRVRRLHTASLRRGKDASGGYLLWVITVLLMMFRVRFLCLAYAVGILGIAQSDSLVGT